MLVLVKCLIPKKYKDFYKAIRYNRLLRSHNTESNSKKRVSTNYLYHHEYSFRIIINLDFRVSNGCCNNNKLEKTNIISLKNIFFGQIDIKPINSIIIMVIGDIEIPSTGIYMPN